MAKKCQTINTAEHYRLLKFLRKFEDMFNGTLGKWNTTPVDLELKDNTKPVCSKTCTVPRLHEAMFKKEGEILLRLGVLEEENES